MTLPVPHPATTKENPTVTTPLITPARAKEIRRIAARQAARILQIAITNWDPNAHVRSDDEADLLNEEITAIYRRLYVQAIAGTNQPCTVCGIPYRVKADGTVGWHHGMTLSGFSTGELCDGVGKQPTPAA